jgi:hypothetical protein
VWQRTDKWRPARTGTASTQSGSGPVQNQTTGELGFAKNTFAHREKLASDLARRVGVSVPEVRLETVEGTNQLHAVSIAFGSESIDVTLLRSRLTERFKSPEVQDALKRASGLLAFHAWIATEDLKDEHLVVAAEPDGSYRVAAIDFAYSMNFGADGGHVLTPSAPPALLAAVDRKEVASTVEKIEKMTDDEITSFVRALPADVADEAEKSKLAAGLCVRRGKIREAMKGWMP